MNDFVFISQKYRDAVAEEITPWGSFPVQYYEEVEFIKRVGRPPWSYYNDMFGENNIMFKNTVVIIMYFRFKDQQARRPYRYFTGIDA